MKLIIDIDEKKYEEIKQIAKAQLELTDKTEAQIIANGTPISNDGDLISRSELKKALDELFESGGYDSGLVMNTINDAPKVAESCKELHEVATERPQTIGCFNCKYETKMLCEEPCMLCNFLYSEWRQKE